MRHITSLLDKQARHGAAAHTHQVRVVDELSRPDSSPLLRRNIGNAMTKEELQTTLKTIIRECSRVCTLKIRCDTSWGFLV